jgi:hypothetical protein
MLQPVYPSLLLQIVFWFLIQIHSAIFSFVRYHQLVVGPPDGLAFVVLLEVVAAHLELPDQPDRVELPDPQETQDLLDPQELTVLPDLPDPPVLMVQQDQQELE